MKKNLIFDICFYPKKYLSLITCIEHVNNILKIQQQYLYKEQDWYLCSTTKKKSSIHKGFDRNGVTEIGLHKLTKEYNKDKKHFCLSIWDKKTEEAGLAYSIYEQTCGQPFKVEIRLDYDVLLSEIALNNIQKFCLALSEQFDGAYIMVNNNYEIEKQIFPDRLSAAWMIYLPEVQLSHNMVPQAFDVISGTDHEEQAAGSLVITVPHFFDEKNIDDIKAVNRVDTKLHELGLLPLYADI